MDGFSGKRHRSGTVVPRRACTLVIRDNTDTKDQKVQFCNRIGCSGRLKYRSGPVHFAEKTKCSIPSTNSVIRKEVVGSSSKACCPITRPKNSGQESPRSISSHLESLQSKSTCVQDESHTAKVICATGGGRNRQAQLQQMRASSTLLVMPAEEGSLFTGLKDSSKRAPRKKPQSGCHYVPTCSSSSSTDSSMSTNRNSISGGCNGLRNLKTNTLSAVIPRGNSSSESRYRRDLFKEKFQVGDRNSFSRVKRERAPSKDGHIFPSTSCTSSSSRSNRNVLPNNASSVQTRRSMGGDTRIMRSNRESVTAFPVTGFQSDIPRSPRLASSSQPTFAASLSASSCHTTPEQIGDSVSRIATFTSTEHSVTQGFRRHNLNGAAEVLLALERIEQDEELTYEQLLLLENNLFFGSLYFYDQHRDMRLDIDNMSYEELLALGDQIGTVSTALSDEAFAKCVKRTIYQTTSLEVRVGGCIEDEANIKCSICQEEYAIGDEIGILGCEHGYHMGCLQQWLGLKNWCPICKASAAP